MCYYFSFSVPFFLLKATLLRSCIYVPKMCVVWGCDLSFFRRSLNDSATPESFLCRVQCWEQGVLKSFVVVVVVVGTLPFRQVFRMAQLGAPSQLPSPGYVLGDTAVGSLALAGGVHHCLSHLAESARCSRTPHPPLVQTKEYSAGCHYADSWFKDGWFKFTFEVFIPARQRILRKLRLLGLSSLSFWIIVIMSWLVCLSVSLFRWLAT